MKIRHCDKCGKNRWDNSPYDHTWWHIMDVGLCCYKCHEKWAKKNKRRNSNDASRL